MSIGYTGIQAIMFDLDGLLVDSERVSKECWLETARHFGVDIAPVYERIVGRGKAYCDRFLTEYFGADPSIPSMRAYKDALMNRRLLEGIPLKAGARRVLKVARDFSFRVALVTGSTKEVTMQRLMPHGLESAFDVMTCVDEVDQGKPSPSLYLATLTKLALSPEHCLAIEDSPSGVKAALAAQIQVVMVPDLLGPDDEIVRAKVAVVNCLDVVAAGIGPQRVEIN